MSKWKMVRLGDVCEIIMGQSPSSETYNDTGEGLPFYQGKTDFGERYPIVRMYCKLPQKTAQKNNILMSVRAPVGPVNIATEKCCIGRGLSALFPHYNILDYNYLFYFCRSKEKEIEKLGTGSTFKAICRKDLESLTLPLPPLDEQKRIADVLDKASELIKKRIEQIRLMDELAKSLFIEMFGDPVENPMGWDVYLIKDLANPEKNSIKAGPFGSSLKKEFYVTQGYKIYGQEQVISGDVDFGDYYISEDKYLELKSYSIKENDVLISLVGTYGKLLIIPHIFRSGIINPRLMKISFDLKRIIPIYFKFFFESDSVKKSLKEKSHGGTMDILNVGIIKMINIPLPPLSLQQEFADRIAVIEQQKALLQDGLAKMETAYKALMQEYFG